MSEQLLLPPNLMPARGPGWKALALSGWALALALGWMHLQRLASPPPTRGSSATVAPSAADPPTANPGAEQVRTLLKLHQPQQALAEIARIWTQCQNQKRLPPPELPELFAQAVRDLSQASSTRPSPDRPLPPQPGGNEPPPPPPPPRPRPPGCEQAEGEVDTESYTRPYAQPYPGRLPGPGYPQAQRRRARLENLPPEPHQPPWTYSPAYAPARDNLEPPPGGQPPEGRGWPDQCPGPPPPPPYEPYYAPPGGRPPGY